MTEEEHKITRALESLLHDYSASASAAAAPPLNSLSAVVQCLESKLGLDLSHKADFIRSQIQNLLFQPQQPPQPPVLVSHKDHFALQQTPTFHHQPPPPAFHSFRSHPVPLPPKPEPVAIQSPKESAPPAKNKRKGGPGGLNKLCGVSPQLEAIVGQPALPRTEIVKQLWAYIRNNKLQDPNNKRKINCNEELRLVFETDCTDMFKMNKLLSKHIFPLEPTKQSSSKKQKANEESGTGPTQTVPVSAPSVAISEALAKFFGVSVTQMLQSEVFSRIWEYIDGNNLKDPHNPMVIICDSKLQELFGCQTLPASEIQNVLSHHHIRA